MQKENGGEWSARSAYLRYGLAVAAVLVAVLFRWVLNPILGERIPYLTIFPAMMIVAVVLGSGPAILTMLTSFSVIEVFFMK